MKTGALRYLRTMLIGFFSLAALLWIAVKQFAVRPEEVLELLLTSGFLVLLVIALAGSATLVWVSLRKLLRGRRED